MESGTVETGGDRSSAGNGAEQGEQRQLEVLNPATGERVATVAVDSAEKVAETVGRLRANQPHWEALGIEGRRRWLDRLRDWMLDNSDRIADILQLETGKVRGDAVAEVPYLASLINFYGKNASKFIGEQAMRPPTPVLASKKLLVRYRPHPVVGVISPWNFPLAMGIGDPIPALVAGAAVVVKPSEFTPLGASEIVRAWKEEIGAPDVFDCLHGTGEIGSAAIDHVDFVQFTGSDRTGRKVMARAAETLTPVSLELGGKDPMIVLADADLDRAANAATWGSTWNAGQACTSVERIYVEEPVYDEFVTRLVGEMKALKQGTDGRGYGCDVGAMTSPNQISVVEDHVADALANGARTLLGGKRREGQGDYFEPTVLVDVDPSMKVMRDETFGPVVGVMKVRDAEQAVQLANDTRYGLSASVFGDRDRAERIARAIEAGAVNVNDVMVNLTVVNLPMGGWKQSGIGFRHGEGGIRKYCRPEALVTARFGGKREPLWFPYSKGRRRLVDRLSRLVSARDWRRRFGLRTRP